MLPVVLVDGELLGRRALHFFEPPGPAPQQATETVGLLRSYTEQQAANHGACRDPMLETVGAFLTYFTLCQEYQDRDMSYRFSGEMRAVYYRSYPLSLKLFLASQLRLPKGEHPVRVDLVDVATREATTIATISAKASADCREVPIQGAIIARIPKPGLYFFNLYADNRLLSCTPIPAEVGRGQFSYTLTDDVAKRVAAGELLILSKRSQPFQQLGNQI